MVRCPGAQAVPVSGEKQNKGAWRALQEAAKRYICNKMFQRNRTRRTVPNR